MADTWSKNYKNRLGAFGSKESDSFKNVTKNFINNTFSNSPSYTTAIFDDAGLDNQSNPIPIDVRLISEKESDIKKLLFKPQVTKKPGNIAQIGSDYWILLDFDVRLNDIYPEAIVGKSNEILKWIDKDLDGNNNQVTRTYRCFVTTRRELRDFDIEEKRYINLPNGQINVFVQYNANTSELIEGQRFILGSKVYKIIGIDDITKVIGSVGLLQFLMEIDIIRAEDNFSTQIAYNGVVYGDSPVPDEGSGTGKLW